MLHCVTRISIFLALGILWPLCLQVFEFSHFHVLAGIIIRNTVISGLFFL